MLCGYGLQRLIDTLASKTIPTVVYRYNEGFRIVNHKSLNASRNSTQCVVCQRAIALKNALRGNTPVNTLSSSMVRLFLTSLYLRAILMSMGRLRPYNRSSVAACNHVKPCSRCRSAVVTGSQCSIFNVVAKAVDQPLCHIGLSGNAQRFTHFRECRVICWDTGSQRLDKTMKCFAGALFNRAIIGTKRPPSLNLRNILQHDYAGADKICPLNRNPCQTANVFICGLSTLRTREMLAVWREPRQCNRLPFTSLHRIDFPHILTIVFRVRVIRPVHRNGIRVVIDRNVNISPDCQLNTGAGSTTSGEVIYKQSHIDLLLF